MKHSRLMKILTLITAGAIFSSPLSACSKTMDPENIPKPPVASTDENGNKDSEAINWAGASTSADSSTEAARTFRYYDVGLFVGSSDILSAYYAFDDPKNYYSDWPDKGLMIPTEEAYKAAAEAYSQYADELSGLDPEELTEAQNRAIADMCYDFKYMAETYRHFYYTPQLYPMGGKQIVYPFLTALIQFESKDDVLRYFKILEDYYDFFSAIVEIEKKRSEMGIGWDDENLDRIIEDCTKMQEDRDINFMKTTFDSKVGALHLSDQETSDLIKRNQELLDTVYYPTMEMLIEKLQELKGICNDKKYLAYTPEGKAYYEALFHEKSGTSLPIEDATHLLDEKIASIYEEYYPRWTSAGSYFTFGGLEFDQACEWCKRFTGEHFPKIMDNELNVYNVPEKFAESMQPARYYSSPIDYYTKHTVWLNRGMLDSPNYDMFTVVSHEMYPGHLYQHQYQAEHLISKYQVFNTSIPYAEGWAEYSEWLMIHYAPFEKEQAENALMAQFLYSTYIAARMSIGVDYQGWTREDCAAYLNHYHQDKQEVVDEYWDRITATQCYSVEYAFGLLFTSQILESAMKELDGICTQEEVLKAYLDLGCAPFEVLSEDMEKFVAAKKG